MQARAFFIDCLSRQRAKLAALYLKNGGGRLTKRGALAGRAFHRKRCALPVALAVRMLCNFVAGELAAVLDKGASGRVGPAAFSP